MGHVSISDDDSDYKKDNMLHSIESHDEISNQASDDVSLSELMFENISDTENSLSIDNDDEELTFEDLSIMDNDITDIDMEGGYSMRPRKSSHGKSSRRKQSRRKVSRRKSSR